MKIMIIADGLGETIYDGAFKKGFLELGHEVYRFTWKEYFKHYQYQKWFDYNVKKSLLKSIYYKFQNKFTFGPEVWKINYDIIKKSLEFQPELVFIYRGTHVYPNTIKKIKNQLSCKVFGYNNDDPFSSSYPKYFWRHYKNGIKYYDHIFSYRYKNIDDYKALGYEQVSLLRSYYLNYSNLHLENLDIKKYKCDVIFIGHFEDDGRDEHIKLLIENNINIKLFGAFWEQSKYYGYFINYFNEDIKPLYSNDYNLALNSAKIALVFLSKQNNDTYTRRCFEIPATKTMMMAEYTDDLNSMFTQGDEAEYFKDKDEFLEKIKYYLANKEKLNEVGENGYKKLINDGHEVIDRCKEIIRVYNEK